MKSYHLANNALLRSCKLFQSITSKYKVQMAAYGVCNIVPLKLIRLIRGSAKPGFFLRLRGSTRMGKWTLWLSVILLPWTSLSDGTKYNGRCFGRISSRTYVQFDMHSSLNEQLGCPASMAQNSGSMVLCTNWDSLRTPGLLGYWQSHQSELCVFSRFRGITSNALFLFDIVRGCHWR